MDEDKLQRKEDRSTEKVEAYKDGWNVAVNEGGVIFCFHLMKAEDPAESFLLI